MRRRLVVGRDVHVVDATEHDVYIESALRLCPGTDVELCGDGRRVALVESWAVARLGQNGPVFRGICRWQPESG